MTAREFILYNVQEDLAAYASPKFKSFKRDTGGRLLEERHKAALEGWARFKPGEWLGTTPSKADRRRLETARDQLEADGFLFVERENGRRTGWVSLSDTGKATAQKLKGA